jgi:pentose-5-phosphate-3-epimerase
MNRPVTAEQQFETFDGDSCVLAVRPDLGVQAVLEHCSYRMAILREFIRESAEDEGGISQNTLFLIESEVDAAKALVDACSSGLMKGGFA